MNVLCDSVCCTTKYGNAILLSATCHGLSSPCSAGYQQHVEVPRCCSTMMAIIVPWCSADRAMPVAWPANLVHTPTHTMFACCLQEPSHEQLPDTGQGGGQAQSSRKRKRVLSTRLKNSLVTGNLASIKRLTGECFAASDACRTAMAYYRVWH